MIVGLGLWQPVSTASLKLTEDLLAGHDAMTKRLALSVSSVDPWLLDLDARRVPPVPIADHIKLATEQTLWLLGFEVEECFVDFDSVGSNWTIHALVFVPAASERGVRIAMAMSIAEVAGLWFAHDEPVDEEVPF